MYPRVAVAAAGTVLTLLGLPSTGALKTISASEHYVALGDSYASGPGIPKQRADPIGYQRSPNIGGLWVTCAQLGPTDPSGDPCQRHATAGGTDLYAQRIASAAPKVGQVLEGIRARSPRATVLLVGDLRILPSATGCYPAFPIAR